MLRSAKPIRIRTIIPIFVKSGKKTKILIGPESVFRVFVCYLFAFDGGASVLCRKAEHDCAEKFGPAHRAAWLQRWHRGICTNMLETYPIRYLIDIHFQEMSEYFFNVGYILNKYLLLLLSNILGICIICLGFV